MSRTVWGSHLDVASLSDLLGGRLAGGGIAALSSTTNGDDWRRSRDEAKAGEASIRLLAGSTKGEGEGSTVGEVFLVKGRTGEVSLFKEAIGETPDGEGSNGEVAKLGEGSTTGEGSTLGEGSTDGEAEVEGTEAKWTLELAKCPLSPNSGEVSILGGRSTAGEGSTLGEGSTDGTEGEAEVEGTEAKRTLKLANCPLSPNSGEVSKVGEGSTTGEGSTLGEGSTDGTDGEAEVDGTEAKRTLELAKCPLSPNRGEASKAGGETSTN